MAMTIHLGEHLFRSVQKAAIPFQYRGRTLLLRAHGSQRIHILEHDVPLAYLTRYTESESGIRLIGSFEGDLPDVYRTLDEALDSLNLNS